ncbi:hypothetical protein AGOR_G00232990 [Albula goreensis]|uniref:Uncharacterized protein n=1 Tax=Albula goreensis TaxID=1534307 RepID=A0A8T3CLE7_9TELE|nr:hypothetical protein AGOR_G00232990 [Albula goreensis]
MGLLPRSHQRCYDLAAGNMKNCVVFFIILVMIFPGALPSHQRRPLSASEERMHVFRLPTIYISRPVPQYFGVPWMFFPRFLPQPIPVPAPVPFPEILPAPVPLPEILPVPAPSPTPVPVPPTPSPRGDI